MQAYFICDRNWAISSMNKDLAQIPAERKSLFAAVRGSTVIYDDKYLSSLPGQGPIAECRNLILCTGNGKKIRNAECFSSLEEMRKAINVSEDNIFIIHGKSILDYFFDDISSFHITKIDYSYMADSYMPNLDESKDFRLVKDSDEMYCHDIVYSFLQYDRVK